MSSREANKDKENPGRKQQQQNNQQYKWGPKRQLSNQQDDWGYKRQRQWNNNSWNNNGGYNNNQRQRYQRVSTSRGSLTFVACILTSMLCAGKVVRRGLQAAMLCLG